MIKIIEKLNSEIIKKEENSKKIFISWSMSIKKLPEGVLKTLEILKEKKYKIFVWDAPWIDWLIQEYFSKNNYFNVFVYSIWEPRVLKSFKFKNKKIFINEYEKDLRKKQTEKDIFMTKQSNVSFVIWDWASKWSFNNILRSIEQSKDIQVFYDNKFIEKNDLTKDFIENIYKNNHKYSLTEYLREEKDNLIVKDTKKMKEVLISKWIISIEEKILNNIDNSLSKKINRWKEIIIYKKVFLDNLFLNKKLKVEQESLF